MEVLCSHDVAEGAVVSKGGIAQHDAGRNAVDARALDESARAWS